MAKRLISSSFPNLHPRLCLRNQPSPRPFSHQLSQVAPRSSANPPTILPKHIHHRFYLANVGGWSTAPIRLLNMPDMVYNRVTHISQYSTYSRDQKSRADKEPLLLEDASIMSGRTPKTVAWTSLGALVITIAGYFIYHSSERKGPITATRPDSVQAIQGAGKVSIGGPFRLVNHEGRVVTDRDFTGNWGVLFFGYTSCPDICPEELQKLAEAVDKIETRTDEKVVPIFITIDPERDSIEQIRAYIQEFHPRFVGLTGSVDDIRQVAREFRVYFKRTEEEGSDYLIDHSVTMYLMDPNMEFVKFFGRDYTADDLAEGVVQEMKKGK